MAEKKSYKDSDIVLNCKIEKNGRIEKLQVSAQTFSMIDFRGATVSGEKYYVDKAVKLGASTEK